jgi:hypothetical protein
MGEMEILMFLVAKFPVLSLVLGVLGTLVVVGQAVVVMTPSKADDAAWEKIKAIPFLGKFVEALTAFAFVQKK